MMDEINSIELPEPDTPELQYLAAIVQRLDALIALAPDATQGEAREREFDSIQFIDGTTGTVRR